MIIKPPRLKPGDSISIIAPAGPVDPSELQPVIERLQMRGFNVLPATHLYERKEYLAGEDISRLEDLHAAFRNKETKAIFCARGGYGTLRILPKIRFSSIRKNPKILVGYSDITSLLLSIHKKTGLVTFHGPMIRDSQKNEGANLDALIQLLCSDRPFSFDLENGRVLRQGSAVGSVIGGNLSLICHLAGTRYMPDPKGAILFIEDTGEAPYRIDRMLTHLKLCGFLKGLRGIVTGRFQDCGEAADIDAILLDTVSEYHFPVVAGVPIGHGEKNLPLPVGGPPALLDTDNLTLTWAEPLVE
ncbi:MAG: LD-carboxypeptidase [Desulfobacteraceae bacterium]|nr:MAG: LD-carboxypeptidase [Desulfobacteraceae bacterium]